MSIGSAAGYCQIHKMDKMFVGTEDATEPTCVRCVADATPKLGRTQTVEDPGEGYFTKGLKSEAKVTIIPALETHGIGKAIVAVTGSRAPMESYIQQALSVLKNVPMPKDLKQFKSLQKAITILESLVENTNG